MNYTAKKVLDKFRKLHTQLKGSDRTVSIANVTRSPAKDAFTRPSKATYTFVEITPLPIVIDTPDEVMLQTIGGSLGRDEKIFTFLADSLVDRDPIDTLGQRVEAYLRERTGQGRGVIQHGETLYSIELFRPTNAIIGVVPQWIVVGKAVVR
jgi:hypothetical protein